MIAPRLNQADLEDIPKHLRDEMEFVFVDTIDKVLAEALPAAAKAKRAPARIERVAADAR